LVVVVMVIGPVAVRSTMRALSLRDTTFMSTEQPAYYRDSVLEVTKIRAGATGPAALV
jgi:hypothetical protein